MIHSSVAEAEGGCAAREDRGARDGAFEVEIRQGSPGTWRERERLWLQPAHERQG